MNKPDYLKEAPCSITICDTEGIVLEMNDKSSNTFAKNGGRELIGKSIMGCHNQKDQDKISGMIAKQEVNVYTIEKEGKRKMIYQCPWFEDGKLGGLVEISMVIPEVIPHFSRNAAFIFHITSQARWAQAQERGFFLPEAYEQDGFIHCSKKEQLECVGERYYAGQSGLILLMIKADKVTSKIVYENLTGGDDLFPHIYGQLSLDAVAFTGPFEQNAEGKFELPKKWEPFSK